MTGDPLPILTPITPDLLHGAIALEPTARGLIPHRLPSWVREQFPEPQLMQVEAHPAGVRLVFTTRATVIALDAAPSRVVYLGSPARPPARYDLLVDGSLAARVPVEGGSETRVDLRTGAVEQTAGDVGSAVFAGLAARDKRIELWLPWTDGLELIRLRTDAPVTPAPASGRPQWLHHGSSISQGSNADGPTGTWPAVAALAAGVELTNLGFGGGAMLDQCVARVLRDTPADVISLEIGINVVNADAMRMRAFVPAVHGFLDTIRDGHPTTPIIVVSPFFCPIHEATPGPGGFDPESFATDQIRFIATGDPTSVAHGALTLEVIREELSRIVVQRSAKDAALRYLNGADLYGPSDFEQFPLADGLHPGPEAHLRMGQSFAAAVFAV